MRKIILEIAVTLDGFIEGPNGELDWVIFDEEMVNYANGFLKTVDAIVYGRKAYEVFGIQSSDASSSEGERQFTETVRDMTKYVFSKSLVRVQGNAVLVKENITDAVKNWKQQEGKDIWLSGGAQIMQDFINFGLVDELRLTIHPVLLREGKPLFTNLQDRHNLKLIKTHIMQSGVLIVYYEQLAK